MPDRFHGKTPAQEPFPWQQSIWQQITDQHRSARLPHALLFSGSGGTGKHHLAMAFAAYLLCREPSRVACGQCSSCQLFAAGTHPDLMRVTPDDKGRQIRIEVIRQVCAFVGKTAQQGGFRVVLIRPADAMNLNAANALLKQLEEPGGNVLFILLSERRHAVMPTLRSRCQQLLFPVPAQSESLAWLKANLSDHAALHGEKLLSMAGGNPLKAQELASEELHKQRDRLFMLMETLTRGNEPVELAHRLLEGDLSWTLTWMQQWLLDWCRWRHHGDEQQLFFPDMLPLYRQWLHTGDPESAYRLFVLIGQLRNQLASGANPNLQLAAETLLIHWTDDML